MSFRAAIVTSIGASLALALVACGASAQGKSATSATSAQLAAPSEPAAATTSAARVVGPPCGAGAAEALARAAGTAATRIYQGELASAETHSDQSQIEGFTPLLAAVAGGERAAVREAVTSLVFSHTHVVRLRVTQGGNVLADVGGPYILAPVGGTLRFHGRAVGHYVFSVQDDLGYVKLETRFIGAPLVLRTGSHEVPVEGVFAPAPQNIPAHGPVSYHGTKYEAYSFDGTAFPSGPLRISLLLPISSSLSTETCARIKAAELGLIAQRVSRRFALSESSFPPYIKLAENLTSALIYIRSGSNQLAGSTRPGPSHLPSEGSVKYHGATYEVSSFSTSSASGQVRVYALVAP